MSKDYSQISFRDLQTIIDDFRNKRDELNKKTKEFITGLQEIDSEIFKSLKTARDSHKKKRDFWNKKVKELKKKKIEYKNLHDNLIEETKKLQKYRSNSSIGTKRFI